jgi:hypothetical protein
MKPFTKHDWYGFAGAEEENGKPALIGYTNKYVIVADINGIGVYPADTSEAFGVSCPYGVAKLLAEKLESMQALTKDDLIEIGFTQY